MKREVIQFQASDFDNTSFGSVYRCPLARATQRHFNDTEWRAGTEFVIKEDENDNRIMHSIIAHIDNEIEYGTDIFGLMDFYRIREEYRINPNYQFAVVIEVYEEGDGRKCDAAGNAEHE